MFSEGRFKSSGDFPLGNKLLMVRPYKWQRTQLCFASWTLINVSEQVGDNIQNPHKETQVEWLYLSKSLELNVSNRSFDSQREGIPNINVFTFSSTCKSINGKHCFHPSCQTWFVRTRPDYLNTVFFSTAKHRHWKTLTCTQCNCQYIIYNKRIRMH